MVRKHIFFKRASYTPSVSLSWEYLLFFISDIQTGEEECCHSSELFLFLESQKLSFYCKRIKNELVTAGVVEEEKVCVVR